LLELGLLLAAAFGAGVVDAIAGGGGLITLPALLAIGMPPHLAIATNKGQASFGAFAATLSFWRKGGVDRPRAPLAFGMSFLGACGGAMLLLAVPRAPLRPIVLALLVGATVVVLLRRDVSARPSRLRRPRLALAAACLVIGAYDGFFGPATGSLLILAFAVLFGDAMTRASGNAKVANLGSNLAALALFAWRGKVAWHFALPMAGVNILGAMLGAHLALKRGDRFVRWVVMAVVGSVLVKLGWELVRR
jgi:uncharacterized protein